jgi:hypothetical protein
VNAALIKLFGEIDDFTADAVIKMGRSGSETMTMPMKFSMLGENIRSELDMSELKGIELPPQAVAQMKQMGMGRITSIVLADKKSTLLVYPDMKSYIEMPMPEEEAKSLDKELKVEKTEVGKETIDGHPTVKQKIILTDDAGKKQELLAWTATDMKNFPVQLEMEAEGTKVTMNYSNVKFGKPDAKLFAAPAGYDRYSNQMELMQKVMQKMMGGNGTPR